MDIMNYIRPDAFILVPALYVLGLFLRQTPHIPVWSHVWIKLAFAVIACLLYYGFIIQAVVQGILVTGAAVISREILQNTMTNINQRRLANNEKKKKEKEEEEKE